MAGRPGYQSFSRSAHTGVMDHPAELEDQKKKELAVSSALFSAYLDPSVRIQPSFSVDLTNATTPTNAALVSSSSLPIWHLSTQN